MRQRHICPRNFDVRDTSKPALEIYNNDRTPDKTWYINGEIVFYCPYCGVDLKNIKSTE